MSDNAKAILRPLYIWTMFESLIFWYAVEKLLWTAEGIAPQEIIVLGLFAQTGQVLLELPSSMIADRWSRRKTLILASVFMMVSTLLVLVWRSFTGFAVMAFAWAIYFSLYSGTLNAYMYDLLKDKGEEQWYRQGISRFHTINIGGLLLASLFSSFIADAFGYLSTYVITIVPTIIAIGIMMRLPETNHKKDAAQLGYTKQIKAAWSQINASAYTRLFLVSLAFVLGGKFVWYEYYQLYAIEKDVLPLAFGLLLVIMHIGNIVGSEAAHRIKRPVRVIVLGIAATLISSIGIIVWGDAISIFPLLGLSFFGTQTLTIIADENYQHAIDSAYRATSISIAGLFSRVLFGIAILYILQQGSSAQSIAIAASVVTLLSSIIFFGRKNLFHET